jgi:hypothetical protein
MVTSKAGEESHVNAGVLSVAEVSCQNVSTTFTSTLTDGEEGSRAGKDGNGGRRKGAKGDSSANSNNSQQRIHVQTIKMTFVITMAYLATYVPWILARFNVIPINFQFVQTFYVNLLLSPILYVFMNRQFKQAAISQLKCCFRSNSKA